MNANKDVLLVKPQNSVVSKEFLALPLTLPVIHASYPRAGSSLAIPRPTDLSSSSPTEKSRSKRYPQHRPTHPVGMPDVYIGFLEPCMEKSPDGQGINIIQARLLLFGV